MSSSAVDAVSGEPKPAFLARSAARSLIGGLAAATAWLAVAVLTAFWPDKPEGDWAYTDDLALACGALGLALVLAAVAAVRFASLEGAQRLSPWLTALALFLIAWEVITA